jgi:hypothetical protein
LKIHFNITLPSTPGSAKWSPSMWCYQGCLSTKRYGMKV